MKLRNKLFALLLCGVVGFGSVTITQAQTVNLPAEVELNLKDFATISELANKYPTQYYTLVNSDEKRIRRVEFLKGPLVVDGEVTVDLPADIIKALRFFDDIRMSGEGSANTKITIVNPKGETMDWKGGSYGSGTKTTRYLKTNTLANTTIGLDNPLLVVDDNGEPIYEGYKMVLKGNAVINEMVLYAEQGVINEYDITAWTVIGEDKPTLDVTVDVDITKNLSIEGEIKLDEDKFKRLHIGSGPISSFDMNKNTSTVDKTNSIPMSKYGFYPGRGTIRFGPHLEDIKAGQAPKLTADEEREGYTDYAYLEKLTVFDQDIVDKTNRLFPFTGDDYVMTFNDWPSWMLNDSNVDLSAGTPAVKHFDAAAELAAETMRLLDQKYADEGPKYVEVKNESSLTNEWEYHKTEPDKAWDYLADFHNQVADAVKAVDETVLVGGPSTASMGIEAGDFNKARTIMKFMDDTKGHLDFYSHHFYESETVVLNDTGSNNVGYTDGRLEAIFSLFENHMYLTDNEKPIVITEQGTLYEGDADRDYWIKLKNYNTYMMTFMNMTDTVEMMVPYLYGVKNWLPNSKDTLYLYANANTALKNPTPMMNYLDLWDEYAGAFVPVKSNQYRVDTNAVLQGNKLYVAVNNMNPNRVNINLDIDTGDAKIVDVTRKHTYLELGELVHEEIPVEDITNVPMRVEETSIFEITLDKAPEFEETVYRKTYYGDKTLVPTSTTPVTFNLECDTEDLTAANLRINIASDTSGFKEDMVINVNGYRVLVDLGHTDQPGRIYTYVDVVVPAEYVKAENEIKITLPANHGYIANVEMTNDYAAAAPVSEDVLELATETAIAMWTRDRIAEVPTSGSNKEAYDGLILAIEYAKDVCEFTLATEKEITKASEALARMVELAERTLIAK
ncbi:beta-agarase [Candidatus Epulonipiscium viviparus]|uniref:beta-agarase n=1 Tax=Candidatus Epulonipiscium viviparus TaxID=420336 RepID=UPI00016C09DC|nr:beta-agarase [Candidatus Epulopiscium viviparus]